jgi:uridine kinase
MKPYLIGITGGTASGKSYVAKKLQDIDPQNIATISQDNYYRGFYRCIPQDTRKKYNYDYPGAIDSQLLLKHIQALLAGDPISMPLYTFTEKDCANNTIEVISKPVLIIEGILALSNSAIRELLNLKIFVAVEPDIRLGRRLLRDIKERGRDVEEALQMYMHSAAPNYRRFVEPKKQYADLIINNNGTVADFDKSIDIVAAKVREVIARRNNPS